jgi:hypothetical protein
MSLYHCNFLSVLIVALSAQNFNVNQSSIKSSHVSTHQCITLTQQVDAAALPVFNQVPSNIVDKTNQAEAKKQQETGNKSTIGDVVHKIDEDDTAIETSTDDDQEAPSATTNEATFAYDSSNYLIDCSDTQLTEDEQQHCNDKSDRFNSDDEMSAAAITNDAAESTTNTDEDTPQPEYTKRDGFMWNILHPFKSLKHHTQKSAATLRSTLITNLHAIDPDEQ